MYVPRFTDYIGENYEKKLCILKVYLKEERIKIGLPLKNIFQNKIFIKKIDGFVRFFIPDFEYEQ